ncbi:MAG TPA: thioredoxin family protein [Thermoanaerobaculia bacterium]|nr:thioredoxin family protein [Thermoanaerobaculia bacterium]
MDQNRFKRTPLLAIVVGSLAVACFAGEFNTVIDIGAPMPSFSNLPATDGSSLSSGQLKEDIVVLVFLANHCPWVQGMDGDLVKLVTETKGKSVRFVGVSVNHREDDRLPAMKEHAQKHGYNFTYVFDESQQLGRALGATRTPEYFVFGKNRKLAYMGAIHDSPARRGRDGEVHYTKGTPTAFHVRDAIQEMLAGKPVSVAETRAHGCSVEYAK